jgi:hypothetical protein
MSVFVSMRGPASAAEIQCLQYCPKMPVPSVSSDEYARNRWPSGRTPTEATCFEALLTGQIVDGDYSKLVTFYRAYHPFLTQFRLNSPGGDVDEAIKIGKLFRKNLIIAWAPIRFSPSTQSLWRVCDGQDCMCASACALIWFGATERHGAVGLHRPRTDDQAFKALSPDEASIVYRQMLNSVTHYLEEMEAPRPMIDAMVATGSAEIRWVDASEDELERPPSIAEWEDASCGSFTTQENDTYLRLMMRMGPAAPKKPTQEEQLLYKLLSERAQKKFTCITFLVDKHRDHLLPP